MADSGVTSLAEELDDLVQEYNSMKVSKSNV